MTEIVNLEARRRRPVPDHATLAVFLAEMSNLRLRPAAITNLVMDRWPSLSGEQVAAAWRTAGAAQALVADVLDALPRGKAG